LHNNVAPQLTRTWLRYIIFGLSILTLLGATGGCGYSHEPLYPQDVRTVAVPILDNRSFYRRVEGDVTEALVKEIELRTPYKVVPSGEADTQIHATITRVGQGRMSRSRDGGLPQEMELIIRASFQWQDLRSGKTLRQRSGMMATGRYVPTQPATEPYQVAQHAAAQRLAQKIVAVMGANW